MITLGSAGGNYYRVAIWRGGITLVTNGGVWCFRLPWSRPLFSERNGYHRMIFRLWGWRLFVRRRAS